MARNQKTQSAAVRFGPALKAFLLCLLIAGAGVGYVSQKNRIHLLSEQMKKIEQRREELKRDRQVLVRKLAVLQSPTELEAQVKRMKLDLEPVAPDRMVRLRVPAASPTNTIGNQRLYAEQLTRAPVVR